jgi:hypothetical protein
MQINCWTGVKWIKVCVAGLKENEQNISPMNAAFHHLKTAT